MTRFPNQGLAKNLVDLERKELGDNVAGSLTQAKNRFRTTRFPPTLPDEDTEERGGLLLGQTSICVI